MKKKVFTILFALVAIAMTAQAQVVLNAENFPDANFRAALTSILGISEGDEITAEKIAATTSLSVSKSWDTPDEEKISDLTGIEHFTALTRLECYYNPLTSLDVSKNTALTRLQCYYNQLTSLDVSKNTALKELWCNNNQLTSLDVSKNTALTRLECYYNPLTSLDVSKNTALTYLVCENNQLTELDVSLNTALAYLYCGNNQLASLDVSKNTALTRLSCVNNQLTSLDVSKNTALKDLYCYSSQIKGAAMDALVASLPTVETGYFCVINTKDENEGNVRTKAQVAIAIGKGWKVYDYNGGNRPYPEYEGSEDPELEALRTMLLDALDYCWKKLEDIEWRLRLKATYEQAPGLYDKTKELWMLIIDAKEAIKEASTKERLMECEYVIEMIFKYLDVLREEVEAFELDIDPVDEDDNIDFGSDMDENSDLDGNIIGDIFYNIGNGNGEYNAEEGCIVLKKTTDDETVDGLSGKDIFGEDFKGQFTGIVFKVPSGKGTVKVTAETTGNMLLKVKIGDNDPVEMELNGKLKISFPYNVSETTFVAIYAGANNEAKGLGTTNATDDATLKIYGIEFERDETTAIDASLNDNGKMTNDNYYSIDGVKLKGEPTKKGIYIYKGKKVKK